MERNDVVRRAWQELEPELAGQGCELIEVEFGRFGGGAVLRLFIDREGGVTIDDCAEVSRYVSVLLDKADFIDDRYMLEVSSPGIDRPLRRLRDFERFVGEKVKVQVSTPILGRKNFRGVLTGIEDGLIAIQDETATHSIHLENVKKANLDR